MVKNMLKVTGVLCHAPDVFPTSNDIVSSKSEVSPMNSEDAIFRSYSIILASSLMKAVLTSLLTILIAEVISPR